MPQPNSSIYCLELIAILCVVCPSGNIAAAPPDWRRSFFVEYYSDTVFPRMNKMGYKAVRNDRWKYIHYVDQKNADELYDLQNDPYELKNLATDAAAASELKTMQSELNRLLAETAGER